MRQLSIILTLIFCLSTVLMAQTNNASICEDNDCSKDVFSVQLDEPLTPNPPDNFSSDRTERFKQAYLKFQQIKLGYAQNSDWKSKHSESMVGGQSCLRHYQLEASFAHEYTQNPDFKKFMDSQISDSKDFLEKGFESSRRGLNLSKRMESNCRNEVNAVENKPGPSLQDLPKAYQKLGRELGYFDEQGNMLRPMKSLTEEKPEQQGKLSKKEQVEQLKNQVNNLPVGQTMQDKINGIQSNLGAAQPKLGGLKTALSALNPRFDALLPRLTGLLGKLKNGQDLLGALKGFNPEISVPGLLSKIGDLFKQGEGLSKRAKDAEDKSKQLKDKQADLAKKANDLLDKVKDRTAAIDGLQKKLDDLAKRKKELTAQLEDKPKKILDELKAKVADVVKEADDLKAQVEKEKQKKDELLKQIEELTKAKDKVADELGKLENEAKDLSKEQEKLEKLTKEVQKQVEDIKKQAEGLEKLKDQLEDLNPALAEAKIDGCEEELAKLLSKIKGVEEKQGWFKRQMNKLQQLPEKLLSKLSDLKLFQEKLKLPINGIAKAKKTLGKLDALLGKGAAIASTVEVLTGKKTKLQTQIEGYDQKLDAIKTTFESKTNNLDQLKGELAKLVAEKSGLTQQLNGTVENAAELEKTVTDFINRYKIFDEKSDCLSKEELEEKIEELKKEQEETEPKVKELEDELNEASKQTKELEQETNEIEELIEEEQAINEEYGSDIALDPVPVEEWAESFEVERPYWDAVFHPDDEVVEGYKGRYFEIQLKDANQNVKLLFGPGEYFMGKSDFRKNYGKTIGAFVTEALHAMKKTDRDKVVLFIQGSADIVGQNTFSGNLDKIYFYDNISLLPQNADNEQFSGAPKDVKVPERNFRNDDLPNLRGQFLKEMIAVYSKKLDPVLLEGAVKDFASEGERNAIIYLFIPETLVSEFEED